MTREKSLNMLNRFRQKQFLTSVLSACFVPALKSQTAAFSKLVTAKGTILENYNVIITLTMLSILDLMLSGVFWG